MVYVFVVCVITLLVLISLARLVEIYSSRNQESIKEENEDNPTYSELLQRPEWKAKRQTILERDKFKCVICGSTEHLHVHHKRYRIDPKTGNKVLPWEYDDDELVTLCSYHHRMIHRRR